MADQGQALPYTAQEMPEVFRWLEDRRELSAAEWRSYEYMDAETQQDCLEEALRYARLAATLRALSSPKEEEALEALKRLRRKVYYYDQGGRCEERDADLATIERALSSPGEPTEPTPQMVDQRGPGDCWTACLSSLTGIPLEDFPPPPEERNVMTEVDYGNAVRSLLIERGWLLTTTWRKRPAGYAIATGNSPRDSTISHCVITLNGEQVHDPHPSRAGIASVGEYEVLIPLAQFGPREKNDA